MSTNATNATKKSITSDHPITIAIAGGGTAGVCLALGILNHAPHIRIHIYEAAARFQEIGAGVAFGINAQRALSHLDHRAGEAYARLATSNVDFNVCAEGRDDGHLQKQTYLRVAMGMAHATDPAFPAGKEVCEVFCEGGFSSVHRARFLNQMVALLPPEVRKQCISFHRRIASVENLDTANQNASSGVRLHFADNTSATADAVIGCDGIKSQLRRSVLGNNNPASYPTFTGKYAYRGLIPMSKAVAALGERSARNGHHRVGYGGHVLTFPIDHGNTLNVVAFRTKTDGPWSSEDWILPATKQDMQRDFAGWGPEVHSILDLMERADKWALLDHPPAKTYHKQGRICLIGDAAHASTPHQGSGAGMAIEDAVVLAKLLGDVQDVEDLQHAFAVYESARKQRTQRVVRASREQSGIYDFEADGIGDDVSRIAEVLPHRWDWIWDYDLEQQVAATRNALREHVALGR